MKQERDIARLKRWYMRRHGEGVPVDEIEIRFRYPFWSSGS